MKKQSSDYIPIYEQMKNDNEEGYKLLSMKEGLKVHWNTPLLIKQNISEAVPLRQQRKSSVFEHRKYRRKY